MNEQQDEIKIVTQPEDSSICGQCCVAMVTGRPLEDVIKIFGHKRSTRTKEVYKALKHFGFNSPDRLQRFTNFSGLPDFGILKITYDWRKNNGHWVVIKNNTVYCPSGDVNHWSEYSGGRGRITSFLPINQ